MRELKAFEIESAIGGHILKGDPLTCAIGVSIDSRKTSAGDIFFALSGENTDGHRFLENACENGASILVISDKTDKYTAFDATYILVDDTLAALQNLSKWYIKDFAMKKVAVTGSVGKTTTRDMLYSILSQAYRTGTNYGNYNSETGLPLTLLSFDAEMRAAVLEMGMDGPGQIRCLAEIAEPDIAVITNIGISHIERLGSRENIFKAKMEVAENFGSANTLVVNADDDLLSKLDGDKLPYRLIKAGTSEGSDARAFDIRELGEEGLKFCLEYGGEVMEIALPVPGTHNAVNAAIAAAAAIEAGADKKDVIAGLASLSMTGGRLKIHKNQRITVIDDTYNAAPESVKSALKTLASFDGRRKVAILGGMNELGYMSETAHKDVGIFAAESGTDVIITIGEKGKMIAEGALSTAKELSGKVMTFDAKEALEGELERIIKDGDTVLVKASRTIGLETVVEAICRLQEVE